MNVFVPAVSTTPVRRPTVRRRIATAAGNVARVVAAATILAARGPAVDAAPAPLPAGPAPLAAGPARATLESYLTAVASKRYDRAFALLSSGDRRYFETAANYASIFEADHVSLQRSRIVGGTETDRGIVASVDETSQYLDAARQSVDVAEGNVLYGLVREGSTFRVKDPYHPWRAIAPAGAVTVVDALTVAVRKISFFTGRVEVVVGFENRGDRTVTILPNRTILRDDRGNVLHCIADPANPYTDRQIRLGLRLAANARYTGALAFASIDRYRPRSLALSVGPLLRDEADRPYAIDVPQVSIPR